MFVVLVTALATWVLMLVLNTANVGSFLVQGTIAVLGGALIGLMVPWYRRRQHRGANR